MYWRIDQSNGIRLKGSYFVMEKGPCNCVRDRFIPNAIYLVGLSKKTEKPIKLRKKKITEKPNRKKKN
jgi:hypothetical protein